MKKILMIILALGLTTSCAHQYRRGTVAKKVDDKTAHVCLGKTEVKKGEKVAFLKHQCERQGDLDDTYTSWCRLQKVGEGKVIRTLSDHYSIVEIKGDFSFDEGTIVQKL